MSATVPVLVDAEARRRAATDFETNLVVLAGAGTGKTSLVVERLLNALGLGIADLDGLAAITFTEKAAGEMRERLATGLDRLRALARAEAKPGGPGDEAARAHAHLVRTGVEPGTVAARALAAMEQLDRATVTTIHGLCSELLRRHPVEAGVDPDFVVDTGEHAVSVGRTAWDAFVVRELGPEAPRAALWTALLDRLPLRTLERMAHELCGFAVPLETLRPPFEAPDPRDLLDGELRELQERLAGALERQGGMTDLALRSFRGLLDCVTALRDGGMDDLAACLKANPDLSRRLEENKFPSASKKLTGVTAEEFKELLTRSRRLLCALMRVDDALLSQAVEALAPFALEFREEYLRRGFVSFDGLLSLARDLLRDHPDVRAAVKRRFRMLLIDEFQDTDPVQHEIALLLAEDETTHARDPYEADLAPGRLFVVGDAKQSIYRFRGADYAAYRRAVERIVEAGGVALDLIGNFRSVPGLIEPVNALFEDRSGLWAASEYQPDYVPIRAVREAEDEHPAVEVWSVAVRDGARAEERREAEGRVLARSIRRLVERDGACGYRDITILFRAFTRISHYLRPLRELGVPFVVDGGRDFLERPEVAQLMAILRTLSQPADQPALLALLRSPAGGVSDVELADFKDEGGRFDWRTEAATPKGRIADCFRALRELAEETRHLPADATVRRVVNRLHLLPLGAAAFEGPQRVANLEKLAGAAGELARDGRLSLEEVVEALREGRLADIEADRPLSDDAAEAVRITSIHRMKGLENRWIFVPDMARQDAPRRDGRLVRVARAAGRPASLGLATTESGEVRGTARVWLDDEDRRHEGAEETRVLYVGLTRARSRLILLVTPSRAVPAWVGALATWGYDAGNPPEDGAHLAGGTVLHRECTPEWAGPDEAPATGAAPHRAARRHAEAVERLRQQARPPLAAPSDHDEAARPAVRAAGARRDLGKALGNVAHRLLERWPGCEPSAVASRLDGLVEAIGQADGVDLEVLRGEAETLFAAFLTSPLAAELDRIEAVGREVPMLLRGPDGAVFRGTIDLLYRDADGKLVVADFKTDRETDDAALIERYSGQLAVYARAVGTALQLPRPPRTELWLLRGGRRIVVS